MVSVHVGRDGEWDLIVAARVPGRRSTGVGAFPQSVPSSGSGSGLALFRDSDSRDGVVHLGKRS